MIYPKGLYPGLIDSTGEKFQKMFVDAANISLDRNKNSRKNSKKVKKSKKWFDNNCNALKCEVREVGKQKHDNPHNNLLKMKYHEKLKEYKRECKSRRYNFWQNKFKDIEYSINDPKAFWEKWKKFSEIDTLKRKPDINGE